MSDGATVNVERHWSRPGPKRDFLLHLARAACSDFSVVLTLGSNAGNFNHFHLDIGPGRFYSA